MEKILPQDRLPEDGEYVLGYFADRPWGARGTEKHKYVVVQYVKGITQAEREALPEGSKRKCIYRSADEGGNNKRGYYWDTFGPGSFLGQECTFWSPLDEPVL